MATAAASGGRVGKKRKYEVDLEGERSLYSSFVTAANSVSTLYTQAVQQQRKVAASASRTALERIICFVLREYATSDTIPKEHLLQMLQQEYQNVDVQELDLQHFPMQFPVMGSAPVSDASAGADHGKSFKAAAAGTPQSCLISPSRRAAAALSVDMQDHDRTNIGDALQDTDFFDAPTQINSQNDAWFDNTRSYS